MKKLFLTTALLVLAFGLTAQTRIATADFNGIRVTNAFNVLLVPSDKNEVVFPENFEFPEVQPRVGRPHQRLTANDLVSVSGNTLTIGYSDTHQNLRYIRSNNNNRRTSKHEIVIYFKSLESLRLSGAVNARSEQLIKGITLEINLSGASDAKLHVEFNQITTTLSGASDLTLTGKANLHKIRASGASDTKARNLETLHTEVTLSGSSDAGILARSVAGNASGASTVFVNSDADVNVRTSGAASVKRR